MNINTDKEVVNINNVLETRSPKGFIDVNENQRSKYFIASSFLFLDQSPKTKLACILKKQGLINENYTVIRKFDIDFSVDSSQEKLIEEILEASTRFEYKDKKNGPSVASCEFSFRELISNISKQSSIHGNVQVNLSGGIVRRLFTESEATCSALFERCKILLPENLMKELLQEKKRNLPDVDVRFDFKSLGENYAEVLDESRKLPLSFVCSKLKEDVQDITVEKIRQFSLSKWHLRDYGKDKFSMLNFAESKFSFSQESSSLEFLFVKDFFNRYLYRRDNIFLDLQPLLKDTKEKLRFHSIDDRQLEAVIHILLGKISLDHFNDPTGFMRIISLLTEGETLANSVSDLEVFKNNFLKNKDRWQNFDSYIEKCLRNHHPNYKEDPSLVDAFIYNLISVFPHFCDDICLAWEKLGVKTNSLLFEMFCRKGMSFEEVQAALGLAALVNMASTEMNSSKPTAILCDHAQCLFIQCKLPKTDHYILIPFDPEKFIAVLRGNWKPELEQLFAEMCPTKNTLADTSLLNAYHMCNNNLLKSTLTYLEDPQTPILKKTFLALEESLGIPFFSAENFAEKICLESTSEARLFWSQVLFQSSVNGFRGMKTKEVEGLRETLVQEPFNKELFLRAWVSLLIKIPKKNLQKLAHSLLERYPVIAFELLQNDFTADWILRLLKIDECLPIAQNLLSMLQKRGVEKRIAPEVEQKLLTKMFQNKEMESEKKHLLATYKALKKYLSRSEKLELSKGIFEFINKLSKEYPEKARELLLITGEQRFLSDKQNCQQACVECLKRDVCDPRISPEKIAEFWSQGEYLEIWQGLETFEEYQNTLLSLSERLTTGESPNNPVKGFEFLERFLSFNLEKGCFEKRIKEVFGCYINYLIDGKHQIEEPLELAKKQIEKYSSLVGDEEKFEYLFSILQARVLQKDWNETEILCDQLRQHALVEEKKEFRVKAWISLLIKSPKKKSQDLALSLLGEHKTVASKLLQNDFTVNWIMQLLEIDECLPAGQKLLSMLQQRQKRITSEVEKKLITKLLQNKELESEKYLLATYKILKDYLSREGKIELPAEIFEFINKLLKEQPEKARELLIIVTDERFLLEKPMCQQPWLECLKRDVHDLKISPEKILGFWLKGERLKIWQGMEASEEYQNAILSLSELLILGESPCDPVKGFKLLEHFLSLKSEKGDFEKRIKTLFDCYVTYLIKGKHKLEKPLELALKYIKKHNSLISDEEEFKYYLTILQARILQKDWKEAEILCDQLLKSSFAEKHIDSLEESIKKIFLVKGKKISESILIQNKTFYLCVEGLSDFWLGHPIETLEIVRNNKCLEEEHKITILKSAIIGIEKKDVEEQKEFLFDPLVSAQKTKLDCAKLAKITLKKLLESPQKNASDCLKLFDYYLTEDTESWSLCTQAFSYCEDVNQVKSCFGKGISFLKDDKTICESYVKFFEFLIKKKDIYALEIISSYHQETGELYQSLLKVNGDLQSKLLALFIQAEILMSNCQSISESKEYLLGFYEKLQFLKSKDTFLLPSEQLILKQLVKSDSENDKKRGLKLICEKIRSFQSKNQPVEHLKGIVQFAIEHVCSNEYLECPIEEIDILCEFAYSFRKTDPDYSLKLCKIFVKKSEYSLIFKTEKLVEFFLCNPPKKQEKEFLQLLEVYLFARLSNSQNLSEIESAYRVLRSRQFTELFSKERVPCDLVHHLWVKYNEVKCEKDIKKRVECYFGVWLAMLSSKHANFWEEKILTLIGEKEDFTDLLYALTPLISEHSIFEGQKTAKKNAKTLPKIHSEELIYCNFLNRLLLKTLAQQKAELEFGSAPLMIAYLEKMILFLKEYSFPSNEEEKILSILFQYCCRCDFGQVDAVYKSIRELDIPKNHKNIFVPLIEKMLHEKNPNIHLAATILMKALVCENKDDEKVLKKLFEKMIDRAMAAVDKMSKETLEEFFFQIRQITVNQRKLNDSAPKIHQDLLQAASFYYLKKLCFIAREYSEISEKIEIFCDAHIAPIALSSIINSIEFFAQNVSENNTLEFEGFLSIVSDMFSCLKKNREFLSKEENFLKKWVGEIGKVIDYVELVCDKNSRITLNIEVYEKIVTEIRDWTQFLEKLGEQGNLQDHRINQNLGLSRILGQLPFEIKNKIQIILAKKIVEDK